MKGLFDGLEQASEHIHVPVEKQETDYVIMIIV